MCLVGMLLFAVTGFTLNHAGQIEAKPRDARVAALREHRPGFRFRVGDHCAEFVEPIRFAV